jgi:hypothetical protein
VTTRNQARRRKGANRQTKGLEWEPLRKLHEAERKRHVEAWAFGREDALGAWDYWKERLTSQATYVYFVQAEGLPEVKIGYATNPITRLAELQCGNAHNLEIVALLLGSKATERTFHTYWREAKVRGEWFGHGCEHAILEMADAVSFLQIKDHREGLDMTYVRDMLPVQMLEVAAA